MASIGNALRNWRDQTHEFVLFFFLAALVWGEISFGWWMVAGTKPGSIGFIYALLSFTVVWLVSSVISRIVSTGEHRPQRREEEVEGAASAHIGSDTAPNGRVI
jgi:membrane protein implicated in regulation of membrane protease activity